MLVQPVGVKGSDDLPKLSGLLRFKLVQGAVRHELLQPYGKGAGHGVVPASGNLNEAVVNLGLNLREFWPGLKSLWRDACALQHLLEHFDLVAPLQRPRDVVR